MLVLSMNMRPHNKPQHFQVVSIASRFTRQWLKLVSAHGKKNPQRELQLFMLFPVCKVLCWTLNLLSHLCIFLQLQVVQLP